MSSATPTTSGVLSERLVRCDGVVACAHCGLPVPPGLVDAASERQFCCHGCSSVYALLHDSDLTGFYRVRDASNATPEPARSTDHGYAEFDDPAFIAAYITALPSGRVGTTLLLEGVHCAACVWLVERLPRLVPGVIEARLDVRRATVHLTWDPATVKLSAVATALDRLGYPPHPPKPSSVSDVRRSEDRAWLARVGIAGALAGNTMLVAFALYGGMFDGMSDRFLTLFRWISAVFGVASLAGPGRLFFRGAWAAVRTRTVNLDVPIALALAVGGAWGLLNTIRSTGEVYFDSITMLVFLLLVGRWIQHARHRRSADAVDLLYTLTPSRATRIESDADGVEVSRSVPLEALVPGDIVEVAPEASVPADGTVARGASELDTSLLTGESTPTKVDVGDQVHAGTLNLASMIRVRVSAAGTEARVARLVRLVEDAASRRAPVVRTADRIAGWFVLVVSTLAVLTVALWWSHGVDAALEHATALLIVSCPCALGLATPLVMTVTAGRMAQARVLIKSGEAIEQLARARRKRPGMLLLDKTGTLTTGRPSMLAWFGDAGTASMVRAIEATSSHPVARALCEGLADGMGSPAGDPPEVTRVPGRGLVGVVDGQRVVVGNAELLASEGVAMNAPFLEEARTRATESACAVIYAARNGVLSFAAVVGDSIRDDARRVLDELRASGWLPRILSGDDPRVVSVVAAQLGLDPCDAEGGLTPEDKLERVRAVVEAGAQRSGPVVMVGDGANDAAALAAAHVGIAVHGGVEASLEAADVAMQRSGLEPLLGLLSASNGAMRRVRICFLVSVTYNATAAALAIAGLVSPVVAAVLMPLSSLSVLTIAAWGPGSSRRPDDRDRWEGM
jgi:Cu2+-exporting ATPase